MRSLRRLTLLTLAAVLLILSLAPALAPAVCAASGETPSDSGPADTQAPTEEPVVYGNYTMIWVSLLIGLICILLAAAIFFFTGNN